MMSGVSDIMGTAASGLGPDFNIMQSISPKLAKYYGYATNPGGMALFQSGGPFGSGSSQPAASAPFHSQGSSGGAAAPATGASTVALQQPSSASQSPKLSANQQQSTGLFGK